MQKRLLLVGLSNIGDAVLTTPVLEALHELHPDALIDIVCDRRSSEIYTHCPYRGRLLHKDKRLPLRGLWGLIRELRQQYYDVVVDLRTDILPYLIRAGRRLPRWRGRPYGAHAVERHMSVVAELYGPRALPAVRVWLGAAEQEFAARHLSAARTLALGPGANWPPKIWPADRFVQLIELVRDHFESIVLLGSGQDVPLARRVVERSVLPVTNLCGRTSLLQAAAVLHRAQAFVGNDSGLGHLGSAVGTATLTLFGPGDPPRYRPWGAHARWVVEPSGDLSRLPAAPVADVLRALLAVSQTGTGVH